MKRLSPMPVESRLEPPFRRVLAIDPGSRSLKMSLVETSLGRLRVLAEQTVDLQDEGLVSTDELHAQLQPILERFGRPPIALALPQHVSTSQVLDLPAGPEAEVQSLIEEEVFKLSGVSDSALIYDVISLQSTAANRQQFWVTLGQETEIRAQIKSLGLEHEDLCGVTTAANALLATFGATCPEIPNAVLIHAGAQNTVLVIVAGGQGVFATSFATGGDYFTRGIAQLEQCPVETAETLKRTKNLLTGPDALPEFAALADAWLSQVLRQLHDWFETAAGSGLKLGDFRIITCGGALEQPGLLEYLAQRSGLPVASWPITGTTTTDHPARGFEVAFGAALQALRKTPQPVTLLPKDYRLAWKKRLVRQWIDCASYALLLVLLLVLVFGTWSKWSLYQYKSALLTQAQTCLEDSRQNRAATTQLISEYQAWQPLLAHQKMTLDTLATLDLLQHSRSNRNFWYVLFADQATYFTQPIPPPPSKATTNAAAKPKPTAPPVALLETNLALAKPGFIAELCLAQDADAARLTFSQLVSQLKQNPLFAKVDSLSSDLRRNLADPQVLVPDRHFSLALELADTDFLRPVRLPPPLRHRTNGPPRWSAGWLRPNLHAAP